MKNTLGSTLAAALFALAALAGAARADGSYSSATGGQLVGMSSMSGEAAGGYMDGSRRASASSMDTGGNSYMAFPCDKYSGEQYNACVDGYNNLGCSAWGGDDWWACKYGEMAAAEQNNSSTDLSVPPSSGGGGGGAVDPISGLLFAGFAALGAAAKRRRR